MSLLKVDVREQLPQLFNNGCFFFPLTCTGNIISGATVCKGPSLTAQGV